MLCLILHYVTLRHNNIESVESRACLKSTAIDFNSVEDIRSAKKVLFAACFEDSIRQTVWLFREGLVLFGRLEKLTTLCLYILGRCLYCVINGIKTRDLISKHTAFSE